MHTNTEDLPANSHVLVVDDDESIRNLLKQVVIGAGFECTVAGCGEDALQTFETKTVDLAITDINMPGMNGIELLAKIKEKYNSDVMVMTGLSTNFTYDKIIELGANDFLSKPMNPKEFLVRMKRILRERFLKIERERAELELQKSLDAMQNTLEQTVTALASTVELRDPYTSGHQKRVAQIADAIACHMDLSATQVRGIRIAGLLHDIGKIGIPSEILSKPGRLDDAEFTLIKKHPLIGHEILKNIEFPSPIAEIILQHHEKIDGSGYPQCLSGNEILLEAKLICVADVVEAMSSHRPYRPALGIDLALDEILKTRAYSMIQR